MEESFESFFDQETLALVKRFENMIRQDEQYFYDVSEFEDIIDFYFFQNDLQKANQCIRQALEQHPGCVDLILKQAQYFINAGDIEDAERIMKELDQIDSIDHEIHFAKGTIYSQIEKPEKAIEEFERAIGGVEYPDDLYTNIAYEYENLGNYDKAIGYLLKASEADPENEAVLYELSFCFEVSQQTHKGIVFLQDFLNKHPYSKAAWFNLGIAFSNQELFEKAIDAYDYVIAIDETFASAYFNKANCYANLSNYDKAIETYFETFFYEEPESVTYYYIAECYEKLRRFDSSLEYYKKAIALDPDFADAWLGVGISYDELGKPQTALPFVRKAIKLTPTMPEYWFILGDLQIKLAKIEEGIASYRKVIELDPEDPEIWLDLSVVYADLKNFEKAYDILAEGLHWHKKHPDFFYGMAYYQYLDGKSNQAGETLSNALAMDFDGHKRLFKTFPEAKNNPAVIGIIESFKK